MRACKVAETMIIVSPSEVSHGVHVRRCVNQNACFGARAYLEIGYSLVPETYRSNRMKRDMTYVHGTEPEITGEVT